VRPYHVGVAAEAHAAAIFARAGYHVLVQYGANQPEYDLAVARGSSPVKISVKGSQDGGWALTASQKKGRTYHEAIDHWAASHADHRTLYCFVQFKGVPLEGTPRMYLASIGEVAAYLRASCGGHGYTSLREKYTWARGKAGGTTDTIPASWVMNRERIEQLLGPADDA
jgi:Holliday junction resolvase-like predicted endonuclease